MWMTFTHSFSGYMFVFVLSPVLGLTTTLDEISSINIGPTPHIPLKIAQNHYEYPRTQNIKSNSDINNILNHTNG